MATSAEAVTIEVKEEAADAKMLPDKQPNDEENPKPEGEEEEEEEVTASRGCGNPLTLIPLVLLGVGAVFMFVPIALSGYLWHIIGGAVGLVGSLFACGCIMRYGGMKYQLDRFKRENTRLSNSNTKLSKDVDTLEVTNQQLGVQVDKLSGTVDELQDVSESLQNDLGQFAEVRSNLEDFAAKTGKDISSVIGDVNGVYDKIFALTVQNEKALLQRIAADLEFMDRDAAMSKQEFQRFIQRIPKHLQERFAAMGTSFEEIAGDDMVIDHHEIGGLIDKLINENADKATAA
ncbi:hypothetical protein BSKO_04757 [Bryopsis sp. KO-2023]|nr:hypothetical protein BSKO_04757 [Bryopsis sp. KO-2023]